MTALRAYTNAQYDDSVVVPKAIFVMCEGADADFSDFPLSIATLTPEYDEFGTGHWNVEKPSLANTSAKLKAFFGFDENASDIHYSQLYYYGEEVASDDFKGLMFDLVEAALDNDSNFSFNKTDRTITIDFINSISDPLVLSAINAVGKAKFSSTGDSLESAGELILTAEAI